jgi:hypothetical protein
VDDPLRARAGALAGVIALAALALAASAVSSVLLLTPASRAAKCWAQTEPHVGWLPLLAGGTAVVLWFVALLLARGDARTRRVLALTSVLGAVVAAAALSPIILIGAGAFTDYAAASQRACGIANLSVAVSAASLTPLVALVLLTLIVGRRSGAFGVRMALGTLAAGGLWAAAILVIRPGL